MIKINKTQILRNDENVDKFGAVDFMIRNFLSWNNFALLMVWKCFLVETLKKMIKIITLSILKTVLFYL